MSYLQCPDCGLTVPAASYYLRGDECPRCLATMIKRATFRPASEAAPVAPGLPLSEASAGAVRRPSASAG